MAKNNVKSNLSKQKLGKVSGYMANVTKSVGYATYNKLKKMNPSVSSFSESNNDIFKTIYRSAIDYRITYRRGVESFKKTQFYEAANIGLNSLKEDIRTGNLYNTQRQKQIDEANMNKFSGSDQSFDLGGLDDIGADDGWGDFGLDGFDESSSSSDITTLEGDQLVSNTIEGTSQASANTISSAVVRAAEYQGEIGVRNTNLMYTLQTREFGKMNSTLDAMNQNFGNIIGYLDQNMSNHLANSTEFYKAATPMLEDTVALLRQIAENTTVKDTDDEDKKKSNKITYDDIVDANGMPNLDMYGKRIGKNIVNYLNEQTMGAGTLLTSMGDANIMASFAANPFGTMMDLAMDKLTPKAIEKGFNEFNKSLAGFFSSYITKLNTMANDENGSMITRAIGSIFGIKPSRKNSIDVSKYNKEKVDWNGKAEKALTEIIPNKLEQIISLLSGQEERYFDYDRGTYKRASDLEKEYDNFENRHWKSASSDIRGTMKDMVDKNMTFNSKKEYDDFLQDIENVFKNLYSENKLLDIKNRNLKEDHYDYDVSSEKSMEMIRVLANQVPMSMWQEYNKNMLEQYEQQKKDYERAQKEGRFNLLFNNANMNQFANEIDGKKNKNKIKTSFNESSLLDVKDNTGHNLFWYMQGLYKEINYIRQYGITNGSNGGYYDEPPEFKKFERDAIPLSSSKKDKRNAETKKKDAREAENRSYLKNRQKHQEKAKEGKESKLINMSDLDTKDISGSLESNMEYNKNRELILNTRQNGRRDNLLERVIAAETASDKVKAVAQKMDELMKKPSEFLEGVLHKADEHLFTLIYGKEGLGEEKRIKGFLDAMLYKMNNVFAKYNTFMEEKILNPLKDALGLDQAKGLFKGLAEKFGLDEKKENVKNWFMDITTGVRENLTAVFEDVKTSVTDTLKEITSPVRERINRNNPFKNNDQNKQLSEEELEDLVSEIEERIEQPKKEQRKKMEDAILRNRLNQSNDPFNKNNNGPNISDFTLDNPELQDKINKQKQEQLRRQLDQMMKKNNDISKYNFKNSYNDNLDKINKKNGFIDTSTYAINMSVLKIEDVLKKIYKEISGKDYSNKKFESSVEKEYKPASDKHLDVSDLYNRKNKSDKSYFELRSKLMNKDEVLKQYSKELARVDKNDTVTINAYERKIKQRISEIMMDPILLNTLLSGNKKNNIFDPLNLNDLQNKTKNNEPSPTNNDFGPRRDPNQPIPEPKPQNNNQNNNRNEFGPRRDNQNNFNNNNLPPLPLNYNNRNNNLPPLPFNPNPNNLPQNRNERNVVTDFMNDINNSINDGIESVFNRRNIPGYAKGGLVDKDKLAVVGKGEYILSKEKQENISKILSEMIKGLQGQKGGIGAAKASNEARNLYIRLVNELGAENLDPNMLMSLLSQGESAQAFSEIETREESKKIADIVNRVKYAMGQRNEGSLDDSGQYTDERRENVFSEAFNVYKSTLDKTLEVIYGDKDASKEQRKNYDAINGVMKDAKLYGSELVTGGLLGGGVSLLTGMIGGPLLGAGLGAGIALTRRNQWLQDKLFGEQIVDDQGNVVGRKNNGLVPSNIVDKLTIAMPDLKKYGITGALAGTILKVVPFGPVGGLVLGSAAAYAKNSGYFQEHLFGEGKALSPENIKKFQDSIPHLIAGAGGGIAASVLGLTTPFGLMGNILLGSGLGFVSQTNKFQTWLFGEYDEQSKTYKGGVVREVKEVLVDPVLDEVQSGFETFKNWVRRDIIDPIASSIQPIAKQIQLIGKATIAKAVNKLSEWIFGMPLKSVGKKIMNKFFNPVKTIGGKAARAIGKKISFVPRTIGAVGRKLRMHQMNIGEADYMGAQERLDYANAQNDMGFFYNEGQNQLKQNRNQLSSQMTKRFGRGANRKLEGLMALGAFDDAEKLINEKFGDIRDDESKEIRDQMLGNLKQYKTLLGGRISFNTYGDRVNIAKNLENQYRAEWIQYNKTHDEQIDFDSYMRMMVGDKYSKKHDKNRYNYQKLDEMIAGSSDEQLRTLNQYFNASSQDDKQYAKSKKDTVKKISEMLKDEGLNLDRKQRKEIKQLLDTGKYDLAIQTIEKFADQKGVKASSFQNYDAIKNMVNDFGVTDKLRLDKEGLNNKFEAKLNELFGSDKLFSNPLEREKAFKAIADELKWRDKNNKHLTDDDVKDNDVQDNVSIITETIMNIQDIMDKQKELAEQTLESLKEQREGRTEDELNSERDRLEDNLYRKEQKKDKTQTEREKLIEQMGYKKGDQIPSRLLNIPISELRKQVEKFTKDINLDKLNKIPQEEIDKALDDLNRTGDFKKFDDFMLKHMDQQEVKDLYEDQLKKFKDQVMKTFPKSFYKSGDLNAIIKAKTLTDLNKELDKLIDKYTHEEETDQQDDQNVGSGDRRRFGKGPVNSAPKAQIKVQAPSPTLKTPMKAPEEETKTIFNSDGTPLKMRKDSKTGDWEADNSDSETKRANDETRELKKKEMTFYDRFLTLFKKQDESEKKEKKEKKGGWLLKLLSILGIGKSILGGIFGKIGGLFGGLFKSGGLLGGLGGLLKGGAGGLLRLVTPLFGGLGKFGLLLGGLMFLPQIMEGFNTYIAPTLSEAWNTTIKPWISDTGIPMLKNGLITLVKALPDILMGTVKFITSELIPTILKGLFGGGNGDGFDVSKITTGVDADNIKAQFEEGTFKKMNNDASKTARNLMENGAETAEDVTRNGADVVEDTTRNGRKKFRIKNPFKKETENAVEDATRNGADAVENTTRNATDAVENTTRNGADAVENATRNATDVVEDVARDGKNVAENAVKQTSRYRLKDAFRVTTEEGSKFVKRGTVDAIKESTGLARTKNILKFAKRGPNAVKNALKGNKASKVLKVGSKVAKKVLNHVPGNKLVKGAVKAGKIGTKAWKKGTEKAGKILGKLYKKSGETKIAKKLAEGVAKAGESDLIKSLAKNAEKALVGILSNDQVVKLLGSEGGKSVASELIEKFVPKVIKKIETAGAEASARILGGAATGGLLNIAFAVGDAISGYNHAATVLGIADEPTRGQKIIAAIFKAVTGFVPGINLIPTEWLFNGLSLVLKPLGLMGNTMKQRDEAQKRLKEYNEENGTDLSLEEFNKKNGVDKDSMVTKGFNWAKDKAGQAWNALTGNTEEEDKTKDTKKDDKSKDKKKDDKSKDKKKDDKSKDNKKGKGPTNPRLFGKGERKPKLFGRGEDDTPKVKVDESLTNKSKEAFKLNSKKIVKASKVVNISSEINDISSTTSHVANSMAEDNSGLIQTVCNNIQTIFSKVFNDETVIGLLGTNSSGNNKGATNSSILITTFIPQILSVVTNNCKNSGNKDIKTYLSALLESSSISSMSSLVTDFVNAYNNPQNIVGEHETYSKGMKVTAGILAVANNRLVIDVILDQKEWNNLIEKYVLPIFGESKNDIKQISEKVAKVAKSINITSSTPQIQKDNMTKIMQTAANKVSKSTTVKANNKSVFSRIKDGIVNTGTNIWNGVKSFGSKIGNWASNAWKGVTSTLGNAAGNLFGWLTGKGEDKENKNHYRPPKAGSIVYGKGDGGKKKYGKGEKMTSVNGNPYFSQKNATGSLHNMISDAGCGPTATAMALSKVTGKSVSPEGIASNGLKNGSWDSDGSRGSLFGTEASKYGVNTKESGGDFDSFDRMVSAGIPTVVSGTVGKGPDSPYTTAGHLVTVFGKDRNGNYVVNDPRGEDYSGAYTKDQLMNGFNNSWSFGKGGYAPTQEDIDAVNDFVGRGNELIDQYDGDESIYASPKEDQKDIKHSKSEIRKLVYGKGDPNKLSYKNGFPYWTQNYGTDTTRHYGLTYRACGPSSAAMMITYNTGKALSPEQACDEVDGHGWNWSGGGAKLGAIEYLAKKYGLSSSGKIDDLATVDKYLNEGYPVIINGCRPDMAGVEFDTRSMKACFSASGHYLAALGKDGEDYIINDPRGAKYSGRRPPSHLKGFVKAIKIGDKKFTLDKSKISELGNAGTSEDGSIPAGETPSQSTSGENTTGDTSGQQQVATQQQTVTQSNDFFSSMTKSALNFSKKLFGFDTSETQQVVTQQQTSDPTQMQTNDPNSSTQQPTSSNNNPTQSSMAGGLFIGDSWGEGISSYVKKDQASIECKSGTRVDYWTDKVASMINDPKYVYTMFGINDTELIGDSYKSVDKYNKNKLTPYLNALRKKWASQPIYVGEVPLLNPKTNTAKLANPYIPDWNRATKSWCDSDSNAYYLSNLCDGAVDSKGMLTAEKTVQDGYHLNDFSIYYNNIKKAITGSQGKGNDDLESYGLGKDSKKKKKKDSKKDSKDNNQSTNNQESSNNSNSSSNGQVKLGSKVLEYATAFAKQKGFGYSQALRDDINHNKKHSDCSSYTQHVFDRAAGVDITSGTESQYQCGTNIERKDLQPSDIVLMKNTNPARASGRPSHSVLYIGDGKFVHSSSTPENGNNIKISDLNSTSYSSKFLIGKRYIDPNKMVDPEIKNPNTEAHFTKATGNFNIQDGLQAGTANESTNSESTSGDTSGTESSGTVITSSGTDFFSRMATSAINFSNKLFGFEPQQEVVQQQQVVNQETTQDPNNNSGGTTPDQSSNTSNSGVQGIKGGIFIGDSWGDLTHEYVEKDGGIPHYKTGSAIRNWYNLGGSTDLISGMESNPPFVYSMFGINDCNNQAEEFGSLQDDYKKKLKGYLDKLRSKWQTQPLFIGAPPLMCEDVKQPYLPVRINKLLPEWNSLLKSWCDSDNNAYYLTNLAAGAVDSSGKLLKDKAMSEGCHLKDSSLYYNNVKNAILGKTGKGEGKEENQEQNGLNLMYPYEQLPISEDKYFDIDEDGSKLTPKQLKARKESDKMLYGKGVKGDKYKMYTVNGFPYYFQSGVSDRYDGLCGPTSASMVVSYNTGQEVTVDKMGEIGISNNGFSGTGCSDANKLFKGYADHFNLSYEYVNDWDKTNKYLEEGYPMILDGYNFSSKYYDRDSQYRLLGKKKYVFSPKGHYVVCPGKVGNDYVINDPVGTYCSGLRTEDSLKGHRWAIKLGDKKFTVDPNQVSKFGSTGFVEDGNLQEGNLSSDGQTADGQTADGQTTTDGTQQQVVQEETGFFNDMANSAVNFGKKLFGFEINESSQQVAQQTTNDEQQSSSENPSEANLNSNGGTPSGTTVREQIFKYWKSAGASNEMAAGICGNAWGETTYQPSANRAGCYTVFSFDKSTIPNDYKSKTGKEWVNNLPNQLDCMWMNINGQLSDTYTNYKIKKEYDNVGSFLNINDVQMATNEWHRLVERSSYSGKYLKSKEDSRRDTVGGNAKPGRVGAAKRAYAAYVNNDFSQDTTDDKSTDTLSSGKGFGFGDPLYGFGDLYIDPVYGFGDPSKLTGVYGWPLDDYHKVTSEFGNRPPVKCENGQMSSKDHKGIDIGTQGANPNIKAFADGTVKDNKSGKNGGRGNFIDIDHGSGIVTRYQHLKDPSPLKVGTKVKGGDVIGVVGKTGNSTSEHLHFQVMDDGNPVDPLKYVNPEGGPTKDMPTTASTVDDSGNTADNSGTTADSGTASSGTTTASGSDFFGDLSNAAVNFSKKLFGFDINDTVSYATSSESSSSNSSSNSALSANGSVIPATNKGEFPKYQLNDEQIKAIARVCDSEQDESFIGSAAEASLIGNHADKGGDATVSDVMREASARWFAGPTRANFHNTSKKASQNSIDAVKYTLVEGKRTLPRYVDEHDCFSDINYVENNGTKFDKKDRGSYKPHVTKVSTVYNDDGGDKPWTFFAFPTDHCDPFGYTSETMRSKWGEDCYSPNQSSEGKGEDCSNGRCGKGGDDDVDFFSSSLNGIKTQDFGLQDGSYHTGVDYGAEEGTLVQSPINGKIVESGRDTRYGLGNVVTVRDKEGNKHKFGHLMNASSSNVGKNIKKNDVIGQVGNTGRSTGSHLHYQVNNKRGVSVNPKDYINNTGGNENKLNDAVLSFKNSNDKVKVSLGNELRDGNISDKTLIKLINLVITILTKISDNTANIKVLTDLVKQIQSKHCECSKDSIKQAQNNNKQNKSQAKQKQTAQLLGNLQKGLTTAQSSETNNVDYIISTLQKLAME